MKEQVHHWLKKLGRTSYLVYDLLQGYKDSFNNILKIITHFSALRIAESVWNEGLLIKEFPPESYTIRCIEDTWEYLKQDNAQEKYVVEMVNDFQTDS